MEPMSYQLLPRLTADQYEALKADIAARGIQVPIEVDEYGNVLDGHHRLQAARELGMPDNAIPKVVRAGLSEEEKLEYALRLNVLRRQLTRSDRRRVAVELRKRGWTQERIAGALGVHVATVSRWLHDVLQTQNVDPASGSSRLPDTVLDRRGRRQPTTKARRKTNTSMAGEGEEDSRQSRELSGTTNRGSTPLQRPELAYFWACVPAQFPGPGPLDSEEYDRALSFEAVVCLLRRLEHAEAASVLDPWRRWHDHHGNATAREDVADLLANLARSLWACTDSSTSSRQSSGETTGL